jgi:conjugal transfer pilus assembly protein TraV
MKFKLTLLLTSVVSLPGCATFFGHDDFGCNGVPDKPACISARDAYFAAAYDHDYARYETSEEAQSDDDAEDNDSDQIVATPKVDDYVVPAMPNKPKPIRTPAKVMRMLIAPYEDAAGDLVVSSYIYSEIEHRKWLYENHTTPTYQSLKLVKSPVASASQEPSEPYQPDVSDIVESARRALTQ